ncbi:MAG: hypothetical protein J6J31_05255 [Thermoguttaceae bacterium]|nr:hypothetical protein [Thermoguttaceae bacterium]
MSKERIESRRAFMRKAGKALGIAAAAVPMLAVSAKIAEAKNENPKQEQGCQAFSCSGSCFGSCSWSCTGGCSTSCMHTCTFFGKGG